MGEFQWLHPASAAAADSALRLRRPPREPNQFGWWVRNCGHSCAPIKSEPGWPGLRCPECMPRENLEWPSPQVQEVRSVSARSKGLWDGLTAHELLVTRAGYLGKIGHRRIGKHPVPLAYIWSGSCRYRGNTARHSNPERLRPEDLEEGMPLPQLSDVQALPAPRTLDIRRRYG